MRLSDGQCLTRLTGAARRLHRKFILYQGEYLGRAAFNTDAAGFAQLVIDFGDPVDHFDCAFRAILFALHALDAAALTVFHNNGFFRVSA